MRAKYLILTMSFMALLFAGCSTGEYDEPDTRVPKVQEPEVSYTRGFYYKGNITLFKANTDEKIYSISGILMLPDTYRYNMAIPLPADECDLNVRMGKGTIIEKGSVRYTLGDEELIGDMPDEGTNEYFNGLSITRTDEESFVVHINPGRLRDYSDVRIMMTPIPFMAYIDSDDPTVPQPGKFENPEDFGLPTEIGLQLFPYTFQDFYRPLMQYHLVEY